LLGLKICQTVGGGGRPDEGPTVHCNVKGGEAGLVLSQTRGRGGTLEGA